MQQLLGDHLGPTTDNAFLRELFLQRLPANVRMVIASFDSTTELAKIAEMADKIMEVATPPTMAAVDITPASDDFHQLKTEVSRLAELVATLTQHRPQRPRSRSRTRRPQSPARPKQQPSQQSSSTLCWYHSKFVEAARKCQEPCTWGNE